MMIVQGKIFIFAASNNLKAEQQLDLQDFKLSIGDSEKILENDTKDELRVLISFRNEVILGFELKALESQASQILARTV